MQIRYYGNFSLQIIFNKPFKYKMDQEHLEDLYDLIDLQRKKINRLIFFFINIIVSYIYIMAGFQTKSFSQHDDYMTPKSAWENIKDYIPKDKVIWEAFYGNGDSGTYLQELGFTRTIHQELDFFDNDLGDSHQQKADLL